ncbi:MAG: hypothetical protein PHH57_01815 [Candidatus Omnitrophica bacterium]|nr:hypothetical protein [Candidatus Omnitrophota bacterium]
MWKKNSNMRMVLFTQIFTFFILVVVGVILFLPSTPALPVEKTLFVFMLAMLVLNFNIFCFFTRGLLGMERQSEALNSSLENINAAGASIDKQLVHLFQVHTRELRETMERQSEALNSSLENINAAGASIDKQLVHLFQVHTRELRETMEQKAQSLDNGLGAIAEQLKPFSHTHAKMWVYLEKANEALKTLERDLIIVSDIMEKNAKICLKQNNGSRG